MHSLAVLTWDPQLRGALILVTAALILPGSVYLLLATNTGAKLGFLLAIAGLSGWLVLLNILWLLGGGLGSIGYKGVAPGWSVVEIVQGDLAAHSAVKAVAGTPGQPQTQFPHGWTFLPAGTSTLASSSPSADTTLTPPAAGTTAKVTRKFAPPFQSTQNYLDVGGWVKGGHNYLFNLFGYKVYWRIRNHFMYFKHQPKYVVIRVQPALPSVTLAGAAATLPANDPTQPITSVVLLRNNGSLRLPPVLIGLAALAIFLLTCENLHAREKELRRRKAEEDAAGGPGPPGARPRPAGELQPA